MADELATGLPDLGGDGAAPAQTIVELRDDSLIKAPGMEKPVAYKDYISGYVPKSDLTRMRQHDSQQLQRERQAVQAQEAQLRAAAQQIAQRMGPTQPGQPDPLAALDAAPYVEGKLVANLVRGLRGELDRRDQAINLLNARLEKVSQGFSSLQGQGHQAAVQSLFSDVRSKTGLPDNDQVKALIESEYHAHDGWDSVSHPEQVEYLAAVVKQRVEGLQAVWRAQQQAKVEEARKRPIVPAAGAPRMRPGANGLGGLPPDQLVDKLWASLTSRTDT